MHCNRVLGFFDDDGLGIDQGKSFACNVTCHISYSNRAVLFALDDTAVLGKNLYGTMESD